MGLLEFGGSILNLVWNLATSLIDSITNGVNFIISSLITIPNFLFDIFNSLPSVFRTGLSGVLGAMIFILVFKVVAIIRTS